MKKSLAALICCLLTPSLLMAEQSLPDFELAEAAVARGEILPLSSILGHVLPLYPGRITEVELELNNGIRVYEVELITEDGRLIEVDVNAATGAILDVDVERIDDPESDGD